MKIKANNPTLKARAIAGSHVVILAWDLAQPSQAFLDSLMGFAIERTEFDQGQPKEKYFLRGIKRFKLKDKGLPPGSLVSSQEHPIQSFQWGDYTAKPGITYDYTITPMHGTPKNLTSVAAESLTVRIKTEPLIEEIHHANSGKPRHDVFFNRGVIGSQAYAREFKNEDPNPDNPNSPEMKWLSRGLFEALIAFIGNATDGYGLRAAFYEFHYEPVAIALAKAVQAGADVKVVYDDESSYKTENRATIQKTGLDNMDVAIPRTVTEGIRHNKFIVLLKGGKPLAVWTGSTNISAGGIFGHSNVGHVVWDSQIAKAYFDYWERLSQNLTPTKLREPNRTATPLPNGKPQKDTVTPLFSPRDDKDANDTLQWYADRMNEAKEIMCITVAFNLDEVFQKVISKDNNVLRYIVKDDDLGASESIGNDRDVLFAAGAYFGSQALANFARERDNPLNTNDYIHTKFMLIDPLSNDPLVVTGSANFSRPSQRINDENMMVIRGNERVADIYFGEYMRVFDHHYARYLVRKLSGQGDGDPDAGYLKEDPKQWVSSHFNKQSYKYKRKRYFVGEPL